MKRSGILLAAILLAGCATEMNEDDCQSANWYATGLEDGAEGKDLERFAQRTEQCADFGIAIDQTSYLDGRVRGLETYCSPLGGLEAGLSGTGYRGVCTAEQELSFLEPYDRGREYYEAREWRDRARSAIDSAHETIRSNRREIRRLQDKLPKIDSERRREEIRDDIRDLLDEMDRAESSLWSLEREVRDAEDNYRDVEWRFRRFEDDLRDRLREEETERLLKKVEE